MSYRAGIGPRSADVLGCESGGPRVVCDGCGAVKSCENKSGMLARWFLERYGTGKPAPGWYRLRTWDEDGDVVNDDRCPKCSPRAPR